MMDRQLLLRELHYKAVRSSGAGGQHVNKASTKVILYFSLLDSKALSKEERELLLVRLKHRISAEGAIQLQCGLHRSQFRNKEVVTDRLLALIQDNLLPEKERKATKPSRKVVAKRLDDKKKHGLKKASRKKPPMDLD